MIFLFFAFISLIYFQTVEAAPNFVSINSKKANSTLLDGTVDILDDKGKSLTKGKIREGLVFTGSASKAKKIRVDFSNAPITTIELDDVVIDDTGTIDLPIDEITTDLHWNKKFAVGDVKGVSFSKGRLTTAGAIGKDLFKCAEWDFASQTCLGHWQKLADITPGIAYTVDFAPGDPGYAESSKKVNVLNKNKELLDYTETTPVESTEIVTLVPAGSQTSATPGPEIIVSQIDTTNPNNDLIIDAINTANDTVVAEAIIVDTTTLAAAETKITVIAESSGKLLSCLDYDEVADTCRKWKKDKNIVIAENYDMTVVSAGKSVFGRAQSGLLVLDNNYQVLNENKETINTKVAVLLKEMNPYKISAYMDNPDVTDEIIVNMASQGSENSDGKAMAFDLSDFSATSADIDAKAVGYDLFKCSDFDFTNQVCNGKYKKHKDLIKDEDYKFSIEKQENQENNVSQFFESKKQIALLDKEDQLFDYTEVAFGTDIEIAPLTPGIIKKIKIRNHLENANNDLRIDEAVEAPREDALQTFAVDPSNLAAAAELEIEAKGNELYKCKDWNFTDGVCFGQWEKIEDLSPGSLYTLTVDQADPGFMETFTEPTSPPPPSSDPASESQTTPDSSTSTSDTTTSADSSTTSEPSTTTDSQESTPPADSSADSTTSSETSSSADSTSTSTSSSSGGGSYSTSGSSSDSSSSTTTTTSSTSTTTTTQKSFFSRLLSFFGVGESTIYDTETALGGGDATNLTQADTLQVSDITTEVKTPDSPVNPSPLPDQPTSLENTIPTDATKLTENQVVSLKQISNVARLPLLQRGFPKDYVSEDVRTLQKFLNAIGITVTKTGPGSSGHETRKYGFNTREAVKRFQLKYDVVKSPQQIGFGYVGPATRAKIRELLEVEPTIEVQPR